MKILTANLAIVQIGLKKLFITNVRLLNLDAPEIMSGPFHDSLPMSYATDYGMIFIRSKDGISHNPLEYSSYEDLAIGAQMFCWELF